MFYALRQTRQIPPKSVSLNGQVIPRSRTIKYLGIHLDNQVTLRRLRDEQAGSADHLMQVVLPQCFKRNNFATTKIKLKIYKSFTFGPPKNTTHNFFA